MTGPGGRVLRAALAGLVPPILGDPGDDVGAVKQAVLARLDDGAAVTYRQLASAVDADHATLRLALEELQDEGAVQPAAVFWRPDRVDGEGPPVGESVAEE